MAFDTFDAGVAPGGLRSKNEIKILICYLFASVNDKMSQSLVVEAIRADELANFFEIVVAFEELLHDGNLRASDIVDNEQTYELTDNGRVSSKPRWRTPSSKNPTTARCGCSASARPHARILWISKKQTTAFWSTAASPAAM